MTLPADSKLIQHPYEQYLAVLKEYVYNSPVWQEKTKEEQANFAKWQEILGNKIKSLEDVLVVGDVLTVVKLMVNRCQKAYLKKMLNKIIQLTDWGLAQQFKSQKSSLYTKW